MDPDEIKRLVAIIDGKMPGGLAIGADQITELEWMGHTNPAAEMRAVLGINLPVETPKFDNTTVVACISLYPLEMKLCPDNITGLCAWGCGRTIQWRPYLAASMVKVCLYCLAERAGEKQ